MGKPTNILAIESSCDDTSAAVLRDGFLLSNVIASQKVHEMYGGVVPELASRAHQQNIIPVVDTALKEAGVKIEEIDAIDAEIATLVVKMKNEAEKIREQVQNIE